MRTLFAFLTLVNIALVAAAVFAVIILYTTTPPECIAASGHNNPTRCHAITK